VPESKTYKPGDWVVHRHHGIGQIESMQMMDISEQAKMYCKIETHGSTIWLPEEMMPSEWLRPIASPSDIQPALEILRSTPRPMSDNLKSRQSLVKNMNTNDEPVVIAELLRDLWALKKEKKSLSQIEEEALRRFTDCFLAEWSASMKVTIEGAKQEFEELLQTGQEQLKDNTSR
jgi:RNA polymerase-interacting CarD/CdnL/TRCF family regulator